MVEPILIAYPILIVEPIPLEEPNLKRDTTPSIPNPIPLDFLEVNVISIPKNIGIITPLSHSKGQHLPKLLKYTLNQQWRRGLVG